MIELEKLRTEMLEMQKAAKNAPTGYENADLDRYRNEINILENLVAELREELRNKRPQSAGATDWEEEKIEYEVKL